MARRTLSILTAGLLLGAATHSVTLFADEDATPDQSTPPENRFSPRAQSVSPKRTRYVVAAMGDSLTDARSHGGKFLDYLKKQCPESRFDNYGKGGQMVNQMRRRFGRDVLGPSKPKYTHVIIFGGVNDLYSDLTAKRTPAKVGKDLSQMYNMARQNGMKVVALTVAPWGGFRRYYNAQRGGTTLEVNRWIKKQKQENKVDYVVDTYPMLSCGDSEKLCPALAAPFRDGIHFGPKGHEKIGKALYESVFSDCK